MQNPWRIWDPPVFPRAPASGRSHCILHLKQFLCVQKYISQVEQNALLNGKIEAIDYQKMLNEINELIGKPYVFYVLTKTFLTLCSFVASVSLILCLIFVDFVWAIMSGVFVVITFVCIRVAGNLYFRTMKNIKEESQISLENIREKYLAETDVKVYFGDYCAWIDFSNLDEERREGVIKVLKVFNTGSAVSKGTIQLPLIM